jgi:hypothetical protein
MTDRTSLRRVLCRHNWQNIEEWVGSLAVLADLSDDDINRLVEEPGHEDALPNRS